MRLLLVDTNLLLLLIVGLAGPNYISAHKRLNGYSGDDYELVSEIVSRFEIILVAHVLTEVSSLSRQIAEPARAAIQEALSHFITQFTELPVSSLSAVQRREFSFLGLTDAVILQTCTSRPRDLAITLFTADQPLVYSARLLGIHVINYREL